MTTTALSVEPLTITIGATVPAIDLAAELTPDVVAALLERKVLVFPRQRLTPDTHRAFAAALGELTPAHPVVPGLDAEHPEIYVLDSGDVARHRSGTPTSRSPAHPRSAPYCGPWTCHPRAATPAGRTWRPPTSHCPRTAAPGRPARSRPRRTQGLRGIPQRPALRRGKPLGGERVRPLDPVIHPVVRVHPETGRRSLFVNPGFTTHIKDVTDTESRAMLDVFFAAVGRPEHSVRHRWTPGDVVVWDNRSTAHYAVDDYGDQHRVTHRITIRGDQPAGTLR